MTSSKIRETAGQQGSRALTAALKTYSKDFKLHYMNASSDLKLEIKS